MNDDLRHHLAAAVGDGGVDAGNVVRPSNVTQLREALAVCATAGASVAPAGSQRASRSDVVIAVDRLDSVRLDAGALLLHAGASASWAAIREAAAARRFAVSALPGVRSDNAGESVARGEIAHRTLAGVDILTPAGALISAGGRTLKDVVGYDLAGLAVGSGDRLGAIVAVTLRLEPAAAKTPAEVGPGPWRGSAGVDVAAAFGA